jgi:hypothetical protein
VSASHVRSMPVARSLMLVLRRPDGAAHIPAAWIIRPISRNAALANTHLYASPFASLRPTRATPKGIYSQNWLEPAFGRGGLGHCRGLMPPGLQSGAATRECSVPQGNIPLSAANAVVIGRTAIHFLPAVCGERLLW